MLICNRVLKPRSQTVIYVVVFIFIVGGVVSGFIPLQTEGKSLTGRDIMVKVKERPDGDDRRAIIHMILINKRNRKRERTLLTYSKDYGKDSKRLMYFLKPADIKGTAFLSWEYDELGKDDDRWLYLPALRKVRRISGKSRNEYFMGTDFTYDDLGDRSVDEDEHKLIGEEKIDGFDCWVIESIPKDKDDMYTKRVIWVRKDSFVPVRIEYYNKQGLLKILTAKDVRQQDGFWTIFHMEMDNISEKHKTIMEMEEVQYNVGIKDNLFRVSTLERGKIR
ncbi:outer membrane lipoprotein-sorting protein [Candidatus Aerophobetes bacterium]|nr:outer membrane lipoprotein-sorting protein [Candidatus Aerophobetes bacterium]